MADSFKQNHQNPWLYVAERAAELGGVSWKDFQSGGVIDELKRQITNHEALIDHYKKKYGHQGILEFSAEVGNIALAQSSVSSLSSFHTDEPGTSKQNSDAGAKTVEEKQIPKAGKVNGGEKASKSVKQTSAVQLNLSEQSEEPDSHIKNKESPSTSNNDHNSMQVPSVAESKDETNVTISQHPQLSKDPKVVISKEDVDMANNADTKIQSPLNESTSSGVSSSSNSTPKLTLKSSRLSLDNKAPKPVFHPLQISTPLDKKVEESPSIKLSLKKPKEATPSTSKANGDKAPAETKKDIKKSQKAEKDSQKEGSSTPKTHKVSASAKNNPFARKPKVKPENSPKVETPKKIAVTPQKMKEEKVPVAEVTKDDVTEKRVDESQAEKDTKLVVDESPIEDPKVQEKLTDSDDFFKCIEGQMESIHEGKKIIGLKTSNESIASIATLPTDCNLPDSEELSTMSFDELLRSSQEPQKAESTPAKAPAPSTKMPLSGGKNLAMMMQQLNPVKLSEELEKAIEAAKQEKLETAKNTELPKDKAETEVEPMEIEMAENKQVTPAKVQMQQLPSDDFEPDYEYDD